MNKFFRKYNKWLLAVFGSGLMVIFLMPEIPSLVSNMGLNRSIVATVDGRSISRQEWSQYQSEAQVIDRLQLTLPFVGTIDSWEQWYLLVREAGEAGMIGGLATSPITDDQAIQISRSLGVSPTTVLQTYTNYIGIVNYLSHLSGSAPLSDRRLRLNGRKLFDTITAQVVSIKADTPDGGQEPDEEQLRAHLELYGDIEPGTGDHGFGYRLPDRLALEWLVIPDSAIRQSLESSEAMNDIELLKYWRRNEGDKGIPEVKAGAEVPEAVHTRLLDELTNERRSELSRKTGDELRSPRRGFKESGGYIVLPEDWDTQRLSLEDLRQWLQAEQGLELPTVERTEGLVPLDELRLIGGIGLASTDKYGQRPINLPALAAEAKEFEGNGLYPIQEGVAGPVLKDRQNNLYVFRVIETDAARPPDDVEEIREELSADLQRLAHYRQLVQTIDDVRTRARAEGLDSLAGTNETSVLGASFQQYDPRFAQFFLQNQGSMPRASQIVPGLGEDRAVVTTVLERASSLDQDGSLVDLSPDERIDVIASEDNLALVVVQLNSRTPITLDEFTVMTEAGLLANLIMQDELVDSGSIADAFTLEALMERHNFVPSGESEQDDQATVDAAGEEDAEASGS